MGGSTNSTQQTNPSAPMAGQVMGYNGYQQPNQVAPIAAPQYPAALSPSLDQAAAATRARMLARTPVVPVAPPKRQPVQMPDRGGNGSASGRGSGGAW
jgi:hypothetical protein